MKAIGFNAYGGNEVVEMLEVPIPTPDTGEVLVRVKAAAVNPADWNIRDGRFKLLMRVQFPFVMGGDLAGVVEAVGDGVTRFKPGDTVYGMSPVNKGGAFAEYAVMDAGHLAPKPGSLTVEEAAAVPLTGLTALQALRAANLPAGAHILINGASGGVGTFAVQIAIAQGLRVTAACSGRNIALVRELGVEAVLDYTTQDITAGEYDAVFDASGIYPFAHWKNALVKGGTFITVNPGHGNPLAKLWVKLTQGKQIVSAFVQSSGDDLRDLGKMIDAGKVRPVIDTQYPLDKTADALAYSETRRARGKLVIVVDEVKQPIH